MSRTPSPKEPIRADHRFIQQLVNSSFKGKMEAIPDEFTKLSQWFSNAGGSWEHLFQGSPNEIQLLKKVIRVAIRYHLVTKKHKWNGEPSRKKPKKPKK
jgi:type IV secretory pathway VirB6-like protein